MAPAPKTWYERLPDGTVNLVLADGTTGNLPEAQALEMIADAEARPQTRIERAVEETEQRQAEILDAPILAGGLGLVRGATLGLSDVLYGQLGGEGLRKFIGDVREENPFASMAGEIAGGLALPGAAAARVGGSLAAGRLTSALAASAAEGATFATQEAITGAALHKKINPGDIAKNVALGVGIGGALSLAGMGISRAAAKGRLGVERAATRRRYAERSLDEKISKRDVIKSDLDTYNRLIDDEGRALIAQRAQIQQEMSALRADQRVNRAALKKAGVTSETVASLRAYSTDPRVPSAVQTEIADALEAGNIKRFRALFHKLQNSEFGWVTKKFKRGDLRAGRDVPRNIRAFRRWRDDPRTPAFMRDKIDDVLEDPLRFSKEDISALRRDLDEATGYARIKSEEAAAFEIGQTVRQADIGEAGLRVRQLQGELDRTNKQLAGKFEDWRPTSGLDIEKLEPEFARLNSEISSGRRGAFRRMGKTVLDMRTALGLFTGFSFGSASLGVLGFGIGHVLRSAMGQRALGAAATGIGRAAPHVGRVGKIAAVKMISRPERPALATRIAELDPDQLGQEAMAGLVEGGLPEPEALELAGFHVRRAWFLKSRLPQSESDMMGWTKFSKYMDAAEDPRRVMRRIAAGRQTPEDMEFLREVLPKQYAQIEAAQSVMLQTGKLKPAKRQALEAIGNYQRRQQTAQTVAGVLAQQAQPAPQQLNILPAGTATQNVAIRQAEAFG